jgi:hypothetical protein
MPENEAYDSDNAPEAPTSEVEQDEDSSGQDDEALLAIEVPSAVTAYPPAPVFNGDPHIVNQAKSFHFELLGLGHAARKTLAAHGYRPEKISDHLFFFTKDALSIITSAIAGDYLQQTNQGLTPSVMYNMLIQMLLIGAYNTSPAAYHKDALLSEKRAFLHYNGELTAEQFSTIQKCIRDVSTTGYDRVFGGNLAVPKAMMEFIKKIGEPFASLFKFADRLQPIDGIKLHLSQDDFHFGASGQGATATGLRTTVNLKKSKTLGPSADIWAGAASRLVVAINLATSSYKESPISNSEIVASQLADFLQTAGIRPGCVMTFLDRGLMGVAQLVAETGVGVVQTCKKGAKNNNATPFTQTGTKLSKKQAKVVRVIDPVGPPCTLFVKTVLNGVTWHNMACRLPGGKIFYMKFTDVRLVNSFALVCAALPYKLKPVAPAKQMILDMLEQHAKLVTQEQRSVFWRIKRKWRLTSTTVCEVLTYHFRMEMFIQLSGIKYANLGGIVNSPGFVEVIGRPNVDAETYTAGRAHLERVYSLTHATNFTISPHLQAVRGNSLAKATLPVLRAAAKALPKDMRIKGSASMELNALRLALQSKLDPLKHKLLDERLNDTNWEKARITETDAMRAGTTLEPELRKALPTFLMEVASRSSGGTTTTTTTTQVVHRYVSPVEDFGLMQSKTHSFMCASVDGVCLTCSTGNPFPMQAATQPAAQTPTQDEDEDEDEEGDAAAEASAPATASPSVNQDLLLELLEFKALSGSAAIAASENSKRSFGTVAYSNISAGSSGSPSALKLFDGNGSYLLQCIQHAAVAGASLVLLVHANARNGSFIRAVQLRVPEQFREQYLTCFNNIAELHFNRVLPPPSSKVGQDEMEFSKAFVQAVGEQNPTTKVEKIKATAQIQYNYAKSATDVMMKETESLTMITSHNRTASSIIFNTFVPLMAVSALRTYRITTCFGQQNLPSQTGTQVFGRKHGDLNDRLAKLGTSQSLIFDLAREAQEFGERLNTMILPVTPGPNATYYAAQGAQAIQDPHYRPDDASWNQHILQQTYEVARGSLRAEAFDADPLLTAFRRHSIASRHAQIKEDPRPRCCMCCTLCAKCNHCGEASCKRCFPNQVKASERREGHLTAIVCGGCRVALCNVPRAAFGGKTCFEAWHDPSREKVDWHHARMTEQASSGPSGLPALAAAASAAALDSSTQVLGVAHPTLSSKRRRKSGSKAGSSSVPFTLDIADDANDDEDE